MTAEQQPSKTIDAWLAIASYAPRTIARIIYQNCVAAVELARKEKDGPR